MTAPGGGLMRSLVERARAGDSGACSEIVRQFESRLFGLVVLITRNTSLAEDVLQDALVRAFDQLHRFDESRELYPWLATIASRLALNALAKGRRVDAYEFATEEIATFPGASVEPDCELVAGERKRALWGAVAELPYGERTAVYLVYRQGLSLAETAQVLGVTGGTVKTWLHRARAKLRLRVAGLEE